MLMVYLDGVDLNSKHLARELLIQREDVAIFDVFALRVLRQHSSAEHAACQRL